MVVMALDHTRDFFHDLTLQGIDPTDALKSTPAFFFTRWITHYCAPIFSFLAGTGVFLAVMRGKSKRDLSWFLVTRGLWLIGLELTLLLWFGWDFHFNPRVYFFATLWSLGWSMIALAGLIHCSLRTVAVFSLLLILGHNAFDGVKPEAFGALSWLWQVLHVQGNLTAGSFSFFVMYPLVPWLGVMSAGYCAGLLYTLDAAVRRRWLLRTGTALIVGFFVLRFSNLYGNLEPWTRHSGLWRTAISFFNVTKYPPSLCYLLMTLGPGLLLLALLERETPRWLRPALVFGRVPFFYYILHIPLIHGLAWIVHRIRHGEVTFSIVRGTPPEGAGITLALTYLVWIAVVVLLYPACRWFADLKRRRRDAWLSYF